MPSDGTSVSTFALYLRLDLVERRLEVLVIDAAHHVAVHVDQPAVGVVGEALVAGRVGDADHRFVVQAQVEDRVHHARHRAGRAATDRDQQRILRVAELACRAPFPAWRRSRATSSIKPAGNLLPLL